MLKTQSSNPLINQSTPLLYVCRNEHRIAFDEQGIGAMRAIMQELTDAEFERLYGTEARSSASRPALVP
jgi:hypothetical protein